MNCHPADDQLIIRDAAVDPALQRVYYRLFVDVLHDGLLKNQAGRYIRGAGLVVKIILRRPGRLEGHCQPLRPRPHHLPDRSQKLLIRGKCACLYVLWLKDHPGNDRRPPRRRVCDVGIGIFS